MPSVTNNKIVEARTCEVGDDSTNFMCPARGSRVARRGEGSKKERLIEYGENLYQQVSFLGKRNVLLLKKFSCS